MYDLLAQRGGGQLYSQLNYWLGSVIESDNARTQGIRETHTKAGQRLRQLETELMHLLGEVLKKRNQRARELDTPDIVAPVGGKAGK